MTKVEQTKAKTLGIFADKLVTPAAAPAKPKAATRARKPAKPPATAAEPPPAAKPQPKYLLTKSARNGILHCEIGAERFARLAAFAYDAQAPVNDLSDCVRQALDAFLDAEEPVLQRLKELMAKARKG